MRITCIIHSLDGGGAERVIASLASKLSRRGHDVALITLDDGHRERYEVDSDVERRRLDVMGESHRWWSKLVNTRKRIGALRTAISQSNPDVVLTFCDRTNILVLMAATALDAPVVVCERSDPSQQHLGPAWELLRRRTYPRAATLIALTETSASHLRSRFDNQVVVIPSAVEQPPIEYDREAAEQNRRILAVGRLEYEKGFDRLIDAFAQFADRSSGWSLRILGEGSRRNELQQRIDDRGLGDRVSLPGWKSPIWNELAEATLFALPSRYEGFPSALLEAMAVGVPCVAVDCESGPRVILDDPQLGLLVPNNTRELALGLEKMVKDPQLRSKMGQAAKSVVNRFGWESMVDMFETTLKKAIDDQKPRR